MIKTQKLIKALKAILKVEKNERDRVIHLEALKRLMSEKEGLVI